MRYANHYGHSDINPYEVVRVVSERCLEVREMASEILNQKELIFVPGGFSSNCSNQRVQRWKIESDVDAPIFRIRLGVRGWRSADGRRFNVSDEPIRFYDYNF
jgi:hypothetical protein